MSQQFPVAFMHFALQLTSAERAMAVAPDYTVLGAHGLTDEIIHSEAFTGFRNIEQAIETGEIPYITNNVVLEHENAPTTNTNFASLRIVVIFTLRDKGFVYVDQHVRSGVINQDTTARLQQIALAWLDAGETNLTTEEMVAQYSTPQ